MSVTLAPPIMLQFQNPNNSGAPAAGFKLFTYQAGTSTKQNTWTDSTQVTLWSNPIVLDSNGAATVWGDPTLGYKFVLAPPTDTDPPTSPLRTVDNVYFPLTSASLASLQFNYPQTGAEALSGIIPTVYAYPAGDIRRYGGLITALDNTRALQSAVTQASNITAGDASEVYVPEGNWQFASTANVPICTVGNNVSIRGAGRDTTTLTVTGSLNTAGFFVGVNISAFKLVDLSVVGNSVASSFTDGGAVYMSITSAATTNCGPYQIERCGFSNFQATYWLQFYAIGTAVQSFRMAGIYIRDNRFTSKSGNAQNTLITVPAHCIAVLGGYTPTATFRDIEVSGNTADCTNIKGFFIDWGGSIHVDVHDNVVVGSGTSSFFTDDSGCYAFTSYQQNHFVITGITAASSAVITTSSAHGFSQGDYITVTQVYDAGFANGNPGTLMQAVNDKTFQATSVSSTTITIGVNTSALSAYSSGGAVSNLSEPDMVTYSSNVVDGVRDAGFYIAAGNHVKLIGNQVTGQTSNVETTLLKGAIVGNGCREIDVRSNQIFACQQGIHLILRLHTGRAAVTGNSVKKMTGGAIYIRVLGSAPNNITGSVGDSVMIADNHLVSENPGGSTAIGVQIDATNVYGVRRVHISNNLIDCITNGILLATNATGDALIYQLKISGNTLVANGNSCVQLATITTPVCDIGNNSFVSGLYFQDVDHLVGTSAIANIHDNYFILTSAFTTHAWVRIINPSAGSQFVGNQFVGATATTMISGADAHNLGRTTPTWTGAQGDRVELPLQIEQGSASSKYIVVGYWYDATAPGWKQMRTLTGN